VGSGSPTGRLGNLLHHRGFTAHDGSLTAAHSVVEIKDVSFDLIANSVLW
jgi:hypothetical protein